MFLQFTFVVVFAQNSAPDPANPVNHRMGLEASAGYSVALGAYSSHDNGNEKSGYAHNGWQMQVTFDWMGKKDFGMALQYTFQRNQVNGLCNLIYPNGTPDTTVTNPWSNHYLMAGPVFMKALGKLHLDAKLLGGVIVSSGSGFDTRNPTDTAVISYSKNIATGFGFQLSGGVGYNFTRHFALKFNLALLGGWPGKNRQYPSQLVGTAFYKDPVTGIEYQKPIYSAPVEYDIKKVVMTLNPSLGVVFRF